MNSLTLLIAAACIFALAYRYYSAFIAAKALMIDPNRETPAHRLHDGKDYVPTNRFILFGHHFAAISGAGPLLGPVLAAQWGLLPSALWLVIGAVVAGAVHDFVILFASVRLNGLSLSHIAGAHISRLARIVTSIAILFIIITALAGLAVVVVSALSESAWGTFSIAATVPAALFIGLYLHVFRRGKVFEASLIGVVLVAAAVIFGNNFANSSLGHYLVLKPETLKIILPVYGFIASVLPVWLLLCPRDYLSSWMKIGTILLLAVGIIVLHPALKMPMVTPFIHGGGVIIPGKVWPYLFITVMCGAISGFHALIGSGTTPKMLSSERDLRFIGYGAMLMESFVGLMALIAAGVLLPYDYFAINAKSLDLIPQWAGNSSNLANLTTMVGEQNLAGRTGGAVSLAVGMAQIFSGIPGMKGLMAYWYHFAIMFEALFVLTTVDTGTRVARFIVHELVRPSDRPDGARASWPTIILTSACASGAWGLLLWGNDIATIWPMFGVANQLLAAIALAIGTTIILRTAQRRSYALITLVPFVFVLVTTIAAGVQNITNVYLVPGPKYSLINTALTGTMLLLTVIITIEAVRSWLRLISEPKVALNEPVPVAQEKTATLRN